jgi:hypothetical protein
MTFGVLCHLLIFLPVIGEQPNRNIEFYGYPVVQNHANLISIVQLLTQQIPVAFDRIILPDVFVAVAIYW